MVLLYFYQIHPMVGLTTVLFSTSLNPYALQDQYLVLAHAQRDTFCIMLFFFIKTNTSLLVRLNTVDFIL